MKTLSFCITCKNRLWQLKKTLPKNLADNHSLKSAIEFVLVDFGSRDGLGAWIKKHCGSALKEGYLKYYHTPDLPGWHASLAKNTAHLLATGKIVTNLDCDNYTGRNGGLFVLNRFKRHPPPIILHQHTGIPTDGSCGRISVDKNIFAYVGGYDESFEPMGFQDIDLLVRLWRIGLRYVIVKNRKYNKAIQNTKAESIAYCSPGLTYDEMNSINRDISFKQFVASKDSIRNNGKYGLADNIFDHNKNRVVPAASATISFSQLIDKYALHPPDDLSNILTGVFGPH